MTETTTESGACACGGACGGSADATPVAEVSDISRGDRPELSLSSAAAPSPVPDASELAPGAEPGDIDVREIPREFRHARVIGQVTSLVPGETLVIAAPHAPTPLLNQIEREVTGDFSFEYLLEGPNVWRVAVNRVTCC